MQTNHNCSSTFLEFILGSNTVCPGLFMGLTVLILEDISAFFLHFCRGTFCFCFFKHASMLTICWERSAHVHGYSLQLRLSQTNEKPPNVFFLPVLI